MHFTLEPVHQSDYEVANWFCSTHRQSPFTHTLIVRRQTPAARFELRNAQFVERRRDGKVIERTIGNATELAHLLNNTFGIEPPATAAEIFARIAPK